MKPLELELSWFGQYTATQVVRFAELDRVFLVTGETGAGKTTLFDAMTYALYGRGLGARDKGAALRSQLAGPEDSTVVRFRFEVRGEAWEVVRSPYRFVRRNRRGNVEADDCAILKRIGGDERVVSNPRELPAAVRSVVGLDYADFSRILVLPQGEFQQFLAMASKQRADLLSTLFPVERHAAIARMAKEQAKDAKDEIEKIEHQLGEAERACDAAAYPALDAAFASEIEAARAVEVASQGAAEAAAAALHGGRALAGQVAQLAGKRAAADAHDATRSQHDARHQALAAARRASTALPAVTKLRDHQDALGHLSREIASASDLLAAARARVDALVPKRDALPAREDGLVAARAERDAGERRVAGLRQWAEARDASARAEERARAAGAAESAARQEAAERQRAVDADDALQAARDEARPALEAARAAVLAIDSSTGDAEATRAWTDTREPQLRAEREAQDGRCRAAEAAHGVAAREADDARSAVEADAAHMLAGTLRVGEPCPVCGSASHPSPRAGAAGTDAAARRREADAALDAALKLREAEGRAAAAMAATEAAEREAFQRAAARLLAAGYGDASAWEAARASAAAALDPLVEADRAHERALATRARRTTALATARGDLAQAEAGARAATNEAAGAAATLAEVQRGLGGEEPGAGDLPAAEAAVARAGDAIAREDAALKTLREDLVAADNALAGASSRVEALAEQRARSDEVGPAIASEAERAVAEAGFADAESALAAALDAQATARLEAEVTTWVQAATALAAEIAQLDGSIAGREAPDLAALEAASLAAAHASAAATETRAGIEERRALLATRHERVLELRRTHDARVAESRGLVEVAGRLNGQIAPKIDFPTWMLTWWLDRVLVRANERMRALSDGRYVFRLRTEQRDGRAAGGLDLDALDTWSNQLRDVRALSGGETFLASLSLALGLADVVQAHNGGVQLDTLFIDEGFGSLDAETLQRAMDLVEQVAEHRSVGLISHVEAMQKAIRSQVRVSKSPRGSEVEVVGGRG